MLGLGYAMHLKLCRLIDNVIPLHLQQEVFVYLNDLLISFETFSEHLQTLTKIALWIWKANLTINIE